MGLESATEALELLDTKGLEAPALSLLTLAAAADPYSSNAFSFHLNFLYTHGHDAAAAARLSAFESALPTSPLITTSRLAVANQSVPMLQQRAQTLNGQVGLPCKACMHTCA